MTDPSQHTIRRTQSVCPVCVAQVDAAIVERDGAIWMVKECQEHGKQDVCLSKHPDYFRELDDFYFSVVRESFPQRDYIVRLTERCNLRCSICLAYANARESEDYPADKLLEFARSRKALKLDLMGAEPTVRADLPDLIRDLSATKCTVALHTNGGKLADVDYLRTLQQAGLNEVHLQFDGLDDRYYEDIRSRKLKDNKLEVLANLEALEVPTDLRATIVRGYNEGEISTVLHTGLQHKCVREILFLGCRSLGLARNVPHTECLLPEDMIDLLCTQTNHRISHQSILRFQKLYFAFLSMFSVRKCFYIHHYLILRDGKGGYIPVDEVLDLESIEAKLDRFKKMKPKWGRLADLVLVASMIPELLRPKALKLIREIVLLKVIFMLGIALARVPKRAIIVGFITACDPFIFDAQVAPNCGKGEVCLDLGTQDSGAVANILREREFWEKQQRR